jgi:DNA invertase Pin-like site-specific DNA recombinase
MPEANELTVHIMAAVAQSERKAISKRTKEALRAAKARGQRLGNPNGAAALRRAQRGNAASLAVIRSAAADRAEQMRPVINDLRTGGVTSLGGMASALNEGGFVTPRGGKWHASSVRNLLARLHQNPGQLVG